MPNFLGISAYYHDAAAALVFDGEVVAAAQEERFSRKKYDAAFPEASIHYCLEAGGLDLVDLDNVVFYDKPMLKFERLLETYLARAPRGFESFRHALPIWMREKLYLKQMLRKKLAETGQLSVDRVPKLLFTEHHQAHAASAFYAGPYKDAAVLCLDGVGEWATTSAWTGDGALLQPLWEIHFPHSLGLLYSAFTSYAGFRVNSGEYKLMGLAPYGKPRYASAIREHLVDIKGDGSFRLNMEYFDFATGLRMTNDRFAALFGASAREPESPLQQHTMDIARSAQEVIEEIVLKLAGTLHKEAGKKNLCLAGGVAQNCVAIGRLARQGPYSQVWVQPAAGDAGGALGAALAGWHIHHQGDRKHIEHDTMRGAYLGPEYDEAECRTLLDQRDAVYECLADEALFVRVAELISLGQVVGWFQGRMEFGPRALGNRSILADPRAPDMQDKLNRKIKFRESFRPFAPAVLAEQASQIFDPGDECPYMTRVDSLNRPRSELPAITHVDGSARVQTVHRETNPRFHALISAFAQHTGVPVVVNTSFNVRGEPIVCTPEDAWECFMASGLDWLVLGNLLVDKRLQPESERARSSLNTGKLADSSLEGTSKTLRQVLGKVGLRVANGLRLFFNSILMVTAFYLIVLPAGFVLRILGMLQYQEGFDDQAQSYRIERKDRPGRKDMENPF